MRACAVFGNARIFSGALQPLWGPFRFIIPALPIRCRARGRPESDSLLKPVDPSSRSL